MDEIEIGASDVDYWLFQFLHTNLESLRESQGYRVH